MAAEVRAVAMVAAVPVAATVVVEKAGVKVEEAMEEATGVVVRAEAKGAVEMVAATVVEGRRWRRGRW